MDYYQKYLKYKTKYLQLKSQLGGDDLERCLPVPTNFIRDLNNTIKRNADLIATRCMKVDFNKDKNVRKLVINELKKILDSNQVIGNEIEEYYKALEAEFIETNSQEVVSLATRLYDHKNFRADGGISPFGVVEKFAKNLRKAHPNFCCRTLGEGETRQYRDKRSAVGTSGRFGESGKTGIPKSPTGSPRSPVSPARSPRK
jgi:hypothetical protein